MKKPAGLEDLQVFCCHPEKVQAFTLAKAALKVALGRITASSLLKSGL